MKINKEELARIATLPDTQMWQAICAIAHSNGYNLRTREPSHEELEKIRGIIRGDVKIGMIDAMRLLNSYKDRG